MSAGSIDVYSLLYIDDDNVPELLFDNSGDGRSTRLLTYVDGKVVENGLQCRGYDFYYIVKGNSVMYS